MSKPWKIAIREEDGKRVRCGADDDGFPRVGEILPRDTYVSSECATTTVSVWCALRGGTMDGGRSAKILSIRRVLIYWGKV